MIPPLILWPWTPFSKSMFKVNDSSTVSMAELHTILTRPPAQFDYEAARALRPLPQKNHVPITSLTTGAWVAGGLALLFWRWLSCRRLRKMILQGTAMERGLRLQLESCSRRIGVRVPIAVVVSKLDAPGINCGLRPRLMWPSTLPEGVTPLAIRGILLHELAHIRRRDHRIAWLVLLGEIVWWWNPLFWFVRRKLHEEAELACDVWVSALLPEARREYADSLISFSDATFRSSNVQPVLGLQSKTTKTFSRRLRMIMEETKRSHRLSHWAILLLALTGLAIIPGWSQGQEDAQPHFKASQTNQTSDSVTSGAPLEIQLTAGGIVRLNQHCLARMITHAKSRSSNSSKRVILHADSASSEADFEMLRGICRSAGFAEVTIEKKRTKSEGALNPAAEPTGPVMLNRAYSVADLVISESINRDLKSLRERLKHRKELADDFEKIEAKIHSKGNLDPLIKLITSIAPASWEEGGGPGAISPFSRTLSLVIRQSEAVHQEISDLLAEMRRLGLGEAIAANDLKRIRAFQLNYESTKE